MLAVKFPQILRIASGGVFLQMKNGVLLRLRPTDSRHPTYARIDDSIPKLTLASMRRHSTMAAKIKMITNGEFVADPPRSDSTRIMRGIRSVGSA